MGVCNLSSKSVTFTHPTTGANLGTQSYAAYGDVLQVLFDALGDPLVLTSSGNFLVYNGGSVPLPAPPAHFDYSSATRTAVVAMPGPDWVTVISFDSADAPVAMTVPLRGGRISSAAPNPARASVRVAFTLAGPGTAAVQLVDAGGRLVSDHPLGRLEAGPREITIDVSALGAGTYFAVLRIDGARADARKVLRIE